MNKEIHLRYFDIYEKELSQIQDSVCELRNSRKLIGQILIGFGCVLVIVIIAIAREPMEYIDLFRSAPIWWKIFMFLLIPICLIFLIYSYFDKSIKFFVDKIGLECDNQKIRWSEVESGYVNHKEYHYGSLNLYLKNGQLIKFDISGLEKRPNEIAKELSKYWSISKKFVVKKI